MEKRNNLFKFKDESGFILAFALLVVAVLLTTALAVSKVMNRELFFSRLVENSRGAYFAADSGLECSEYINNVLKDESVGKALFLNQQKTTDLHNEFVQNAENNIFFSSSSVLNIVSDLNYVTCASDNGSDNRVFTRSPSGDNAGYVNSRDDVINNLNQEKSSYTLVGDSTHATTTFGFVLLDQDTNRCVLVDYAKSSYDENNDATVNFTITSTGFSDCNPNDKSRVTRTIYRFSTN